MKYFEHYNFFTTKPAGKKTINQSLLEIVAHTRINPGIAQIGQ